MEGMQQLLQLAVKVNQSGSLEEKRAFLKTVFGMFVDLLENAPEDFVNELTMAIPIILTKGMMDVQKKMEE